MAASNRMERGDEKTAHSGEPPSFLLGAPSSPRSSTVSDFDFRVSLIPSYTAAIAEPAPRGERTRRWPHPRSFRFLALPPPLLCLRFRSRTVMASIAPHNAIAELPTLEAGQRAGSPPSSDSDEKVSSSSASLDGEKGAGVAYESRGRFEGEYDPAVVGHPWRIKGPAVLAVLFFSRALPCFRSYLRVR